LARKVQSSTHETPQLVTLRD